MGRKLLGWKRKDGKMSARRNRSPTRRDKGAKPGREQMTFPDGYLLAFGSRGNLRGRAQEKYYGRFAEICTENAKM